MQHFYNPAGEGDDMTSSTLTVILETMFHFNILSLYFCCKLFCLAIIVHVQNFLPFTINCDRIENILGYKYILYIKVIVPRLRT